MEDILSLAGKVALVTGAGRGIGRAIAITLARNGAAVAVNDADILKAKEIATEISALGGTSMPAAGNVADSRDIRIMVKSVIRKFGRIDILVNNAGILRRTFIDKLDEREWDLVMDVNLKGAFLCSKAVLPGMQARKSGKIINIASDAGKSTSTLGGVHYTTSKAGLLGFTRHLARELAPHGINVNAVCPGVVDTPMTRNNAGAGEWRRIIGSLPIRRAARPAEIANVVLFLASDLASYLIGASVDVNGGTLII